MSRQLGPWQHAGIYRRRLFSAAECGHWLAVLAQTDDWSAARVTGSTARSRHASLLRPAVRAADVSSVAAQPVLWERFVERTAQRLLPALQQTFGARDLSIEEYSAIRYEPGGRYLPHVDNGEAFAQRQFSVVCYLNDDFTGGETDFPALGITVKPKAGLAIAFPSEYLHAALPVISGSKQVLVAWLHGPRIRWL